MKYFEDWLFASDKEIGPYNFLGMGSIICFAALDTPHAA
jgi:hypothetical protein